MVDLSKQKLSTFLFSIEQFIKNQTKKSPDVLNKCKSKDYTIQFLSFDETVSKYFIFKEGKLITRSGIHPFPDFTAVFKDTVDYTSLLSSIISQTEIIDFLKSTAVTYSGKEDYILWFFETLSLIFEASTEYGEKINNGENIFTSTAGDCPAKIYVKHNKISRTSAIKLNEREAPIWNIQARNKNFSPSSQINVSANALGYKSTIYAENRILAPMIRKDFDPNGRANQQNRGKSEFKRISWEEAFKIVANEISKAKPAANQQTVAVTMSPEHNFGIIGSEYSCHNRFFQLIDNVKVINLSKDISWYWGAMPQWGHFENKGLPYSAGNLEDILKNCENIIFWSCDAIKQNCPDASQRLHWLKKTGINCIHIDPEYTLTNSFLGGKWLPIKPGTGVALSMSIAYIWLSNNWVDASFVKQYTIGFNTWKDFILGKTDGIPKSPGWQESITGIKARDVQALAQEWAQKRTYLFCGGNTNNDFRENSTEFGIDFVKNLVFLQAMRGIGKQGIGFGSTDNVPLNDDFYFPGLQDGGITFASTDKISDFEWISKLKEFNINQSNINQIPYYQLYSKNFNNKYFILPNANNLLEMANTTENKNSGKTIALLYQVGNNFSSSNRITGQMRDFYLSDKVRTLVNQSSWLEGDALYADILLPSCTMPERWDIMDNHNTGYSSAKAYKQDNYRFVYLSQKVIPPLGESKPDFDIYYGLAKNLGCGYKYSKGLNELEWCKKIFAATDLPKFLSWERFAKRSYFVIPLKEKTPKGLYETTVYQTLQIENPVSRFSTENGLQIDRKIFDNNTGKINFDNKYLYNPDFELINNVVFSGDSLIKKLQATTDNGFNFRLLISPNNCNCSNNHLKNHNQFNKQEISISQDYPLVLINQQDARQHSIEDGNLLKINNNNGEIIGCAKTTEEILPGTIKIYSNYQTTDNKAYSTKNITQKIPAGMPVSQSYGIETLLNNQLSENKILKPISSIIFVNLQKIDNE